MHWSLWGVAAGYAQRRDTLRADGGFLFEVLRKDPAVKRSTLAVDARPDLAAALHKVFPHFAKVIRDDASVYKVTDEFHVGFMAHMAAQGRGN